VLVLVLPPPLLPTPPTPTFLQPQAYCNFKLSKKQCSFGNDVVKLRILSFFDFRELSMNRRLCWLVILPRGRPSIIAGVVGTGVTMTMMMAMMTRPKIIVLADEKRATLPREIAIVTGATVAAVATVATTVTTVVVVAVVMKMKAIVARAEYC
jgi:hypothetical protein